MSENKYDLNKISKIKNGIKDALNLSEKEPQVNMKERDFYRELDKKKNNRNCSLPMVGLLLLIIFILIIYFLVYIKNYTKIGIDYIAQNRSETQESLQSDFIDNTKELLPGETLLLEYSEVDVSGYLGIYDEDFPLKRSSLRIEERGIIVSGRTSDNWYSLPVHTVVRPKIDGGQLTFVLDELASGAISLPKGIRDNVSQYLVRLMKTRALYDAELEVVSAYTSKEKLIIEVSKKG
ncbi:MAG: hypothetical protein BWY19_00324 [bacterium ADurb.Bin212]|nr:MAG: hypothetical protein BWY19_00324 [bacterium ADurb.Bin212]